MRRTDGEQVASGTKPHTPFVELCKPSSRKSISTNSLSCSHTETPPPNPFPSGLLTPSRMQTQELLAGRQLPGKLQVSQKPGMQMGPQAGQ